MNTKSPRALQDVPLAGDRTRWANLVDRLDVDALTDTFVGLVATVPGYDPPPVPRAEIVRTGRLSFLALIDGLRSGGLTAQLLVSSDVGVSRARAGIPITSLMTAIRLDFTVLWQALTSIADADDAELIVRHTGIVLHTVDEYAGQTQRAYLAELQRMREEESSVRQGLIARMFQSPHPDDEHLRSIAADLDLPPDAPLSVAAATGDDIATLRVFVAEYERAGATVFAHHFGDTLVVFTRAIVLPGSRIAELRERIFSLRVGLVPVPLGIRKLRQGAETARDLARIIAPGETGAMTWARGWARLAARSLLASGNPVLSDVHLALAECGDAERARLEEAVQSYLRTGLVADSAAELFCHRNTITNRLRRFTELTGVDPTVPEQAARLVVGWA